MLNQNLYLNIVDVGFKLKTIACIKRCSQDIVYIGDLVHATESEISRFSSGKGQLKEIKNTLDAMGLSLNMCIEDWPPDNLEELTKMYDDVDI